MPRLTQDTARLAQLSLTGLSPSLAELSNSVQLALQVLNAVLQPRIASYSVWAVPRSLAATKGITDLFSFPRVTEMFHFSRLPSLTYEFS